MLVIDASAVLELILRTPLAYRVESLVFSHESRLHAPDLIDLEVIQVLRHYYENAELSYSRAQEALTDFSHLRIKRHATTPFLARIWDLQSSVTAYDAAYLALAESLPAPLVTCDTRVGLTEGHHALIEIP